MSGRWLVVVMLRGLVMATAGVLGASCGGSHSAKTPRVGQLPAAGAIIYSIHSDGALGFGAYEEGRLRGRRPDSDTGLTETDHRVVSKVSADGRLIVISDFHTAGGGVFARWRSPKNGVRTKRLRYDVTGPIALCGSRAVAYVDDDDRLMLWTVGATGVRAVAAPLPLRNITCSGPESQIAALGPDGTLMLGTSHVGLKTAGSLKFSTIAWSPDGHTLAACTLHGDTPPALVLVSHDGSIQRRVADAHDQCDEIAWSPNQRRIAFADFRLGPLQVACLCDEATMTIATDAGGALWSPDGTAIAYSRLFDLYAVEYPSGQPVLLTSQPFSQLIAWVDGPAARRVRTLADSSPCC